MRIAIYLNVDNPEDAIAVSKRLAPWKEKIRRIGANEVMELTRISDKRKTLILRYIPAEPLPMGQLYRRLRLRRTAVRKRSYTTFQRDIYELIATGQLHGTTQDNGTNASTTLIALPTTVKR